MSYNGSGTFVVNSSGQPVVTGTVISSTAFNALTADLATGLSTAITKDGQTTTTARILFAQGVSSTLVTDATSATTGSIITAGGISTQKALWVGTTSRLVGNTQHDGLVGIGMTPTNVLDITQNQNGPSVIQLLNNSGGTSSRGLINLKNGTSEISLSMLGTAWTTAGINIQDGAMLYTSGTGGWNIGCSGAYPLRFFIAASEAARIDSSGNLLVGISTPFTGDHSTISVATGGPALWVQNRGAAPTLFLSTYTSASTAAMFACYNSSASGSAGTLAFSVASNGNALNTNGSYGTISDLKLKQDIVPAKSQWDDIKTIAASMSKYRFKKDPTGPLLLGFIAQDLQKISPGLVEENNDIDPETKEETGEVTLSVKSSIVYMKAVKALGEALERIETLETRLAALESK